MPTQVAITRLKELIEAMPGILERAPRNGTDPAKWSSKEILGHLIDSACNNHQRFIRAQYEASPVVWYDQDEWVKRNNYRNFDQATMLQLWCAYNRLLVHGIESMGPEVLGRTCRDKDGSEQTLSFLITDYVAHLEHHMEQLVQRSR